ncbi:MAG: universal stress protein, partial [Acidimicrobiia bacterium]
MSAYRRILVGAHGSPTSSVAEETAARLAKKLGAELILVHVSDGETSNEADVDVLQAALERARNLGIEARAEHRTGEPATAIMTAAAELRADLLVIGDHGMGSASR